MPTRKPLFRAHAAVLALALAVGAAVVPDQVAADPPTCPEETWSALDAGVLAVTCGKPVEVGSERGETSRVHANPSGTYTLTESLVPERVHLPDGNWVPVDTVIRDNGDGTLSPGATTVDLTFSGGGDGPLATIAEGGRSLTFDWPDPLPVPTVDGPTVTYPEVLPGVDLRIVVEPDGFVHHLVVKDRESARNPALREIVFPVEQRGVALVADPDTGVVSAVDESGAALFGEAVPYMWDSNPEAAEFADLGVELGGGALTLAPDPDLLTGADTVYPVYIDPPWTSKRNHFTTLASHQEKPLYDKTLPGPNDDTHGSVKVGNSGQGFKVRQIFNMKLGTVAGAKILNATFSLTHTWTWTWCQSDSPIQIFETKAFSSASTWFTGVNDADSWDNALDTSYQARAVGQDCGTDPIEFDVTDRIQARATERKDSINLGLKAKNESTTDGWRRFKLDPKIAIEYNRPPATPTSLAVRADGNKIPCTTTPVWVNDTTPKVSATVTDPDHDTVTGYLQWRAKGSADAWKELTAGAADDGAAEATVTPAFAAGDAGTGGLYELRARAKDRYQYSSWTKACYFGVDVTAPAAPVTLTSTDYPADGAFHGGEGHTGSFTLTPSATRPGDVASYVVTVNQTDVNAGQTVASDGTAHPVAFALTPTQDGDNVVRIWARDRAGNLSAPITYIFKAGMGAPPIADWTFDTRDNGNVPDLSGNGHTLNKVGTPTAPRGRLHSDTGAGFSGDDGFRTTGPVVDTTGSFAVSGWARLTSLAADGTVVAQAAGERPGFYVKYKSDEKKWRLSVPTADVADPEWYVIRSKDEARLGAWTHLFATYNAGTKKLAFYVDGALQGTMTRTIAFASNGPLGIGQATNTAGEAWSPMVGDIDEVKIWDRAVVDASQVVALATKPLRQTRWRLDDDGADSSGRGIGLDTTGAGLSFADGAMRTDGTSCGQTAGPALWTNTSFSVAVWVRLDAKTTSHTVVSQAGTYRPSFYLRYGQPSGGALGDTWQFLMPVSNAQDTEYVTVAAPNKVELGKWTHLAATFDARTDTMSLYVNGSLAGTAVNHSAWHASGPMLVGCAGRTGAGDKIYYRWKGAIDDVHTFVGVLPATGLGSSVTSVMRQGGHDPNALTSYLREEATFLQVEDGAGSAVLTGDELPESEEWSVHAGWSSEDGGYAAANTTATAGDYTGDGSTDVAVAHSADGTAVEVRTFSRDDGVLTEAAPPQTLNVGWRPSAVRLTSGDHDGDGREDLFAVSDTGNCTIAVEVFPATEDGTGFATTASFRTEMAWCFADLGTVAAVDTDADGGADLVATHRGAAGLELYAWRSSGTGLEAPVLTWSGGWSFDGARLVGGADVSGDGREDLVFMRDKGSGVYTFEVMLGDGTALQGPAVWWTNPASTGSDLSQGKQFLVDVDDDGDADLVQALPPEAGRTQLMYLAADSSVFTGFPAWRVLYDSGTDGLDLSAITPV